MCTSRRVGIVCNYTHSTESIFSCWIKTGSVNTYNKMLVWICLVCVDFILFFSFHSYKKHTDKNAQNKKLYFYKKEILSFFRDKNVAILANLNQRKKSADVCEFMLDNNFFFLI